MRTGHSRALIAVAAMLLCADFAHADWPNLRRRDSRAQEALVPELAKIRKQHPRIFCTEQDIAEVRRRCQAVPAVAEVWRFVHEWARGDHYFRNLWATPAQLQACVIAYRVADRDPAILRHCLAIADYLSEAQGDGWTWPRIAKSLAMAYDWLYDDLSPQQRRKYGAASIHAAQQCYRTWRHSEFNNHVYLEYGPILYTGIALWQEGIDDQAARRLALDGLDLLVNHFMPAHDLVSAGDGGWHESMSYHAFFTYEFAHLIELWSSASGQNLWEDFSGLDGEAAWLIHNARPFDDKRVSVADIGGHDSYEGNIAAYMPLLQRRRGDGLAGWWADQIKQEAIRRDRAGVRYQLGAGTWWPYVLWYDPEVPAVSRDQLPLSRHFRGIGWVSMRSSWRRDATFGLFICAPLYLGGHQHCDNNSFVIHKRSLLAMDTGVYDATAHRANYYARTIAHNCVTVTDPAEQFDGGVWGYNRPGEGANDGGQLYGGGPDFVGDVVPGDEHHRAQITAYKATDHYTFVVGDATRSYSASKLKEFTRAFLYLRPDCFVVFDRVEATRPGFSKKWLLHSAQEPRLDGTRVEIINGEGRLAVESLLPEGPRIAAIGGPGREFEVNGVNYPPQKQHDPEEAGRWRIEVSPSRPQTRDYFLQVLLATDATSQEWPNARLTQEEGEIGAALTLDDTAVEVRFTTEGPLTGQVTIRDRGTGQVVVEESLSE
ncbi:MAG: heparinase II/III family protein [Armatimonadota bacterium]